MNDVGFPLGLSLRTALLATAVVVPLGVVIADWQARHRYPGHGLVGTLLLLPLVLPPTVTGYYLVRVLGHNGWIGGPIQRLTGASIMFTFWACVVASATVALPLVVRSVQGAIEAFPPMRRSRIRSARGYVPQHAALFPHLSVRDNVAFGVRNGNRAARVDEVLAQLGLVALADRRPASLSGGESQRVAVARALAPRPETLLLDEPFSALDRRARLELRAWFRGHLRGLVVVFVTHDAEEAIELGDHLVLLDGGRPVGEGLPRAVLERAGADA